MENLESTGELITKSKKVGCARAMMLPGRHRWRGWCEWNLGWLVSAVVGPVFGLAEAGREAEAEEGDDGLQDQDHEEDSHIELTVARLSGSPPDGDRDDEEQHDGAPDTVRPADLTFVVGVTPEVVDPEQTAAVQPEHAGTSAADDEQDGEELQPAVVGPAEAEPFDRCAIAGDV